MPRRDARREFVMPWAGILSVGVGAAIGAWLRWWLGIVLNPLFPTLPLGTLTANLVGGLLMGVAMELLTRHAVVPPEVRLLITTGFLGGLTTFSTFSAEIVTLLLRKEYLWGTIAIAGHVVGSLAMTILGILLMRALFVWGTS
jgi:CrcB protein